MPTAAAYRVAARVLANRTGLTADQQKSAPKQVDDKFKEVKKNNPSYSDEQAWATAWSIYCKHVDPGSDHCHKSTGEYLKNASLAARIAARYQRDVLAARWDGKIVGKDFRLQWTRDTFQLDELPQKGKRKLRVATHDNVGNRYSGRSHDVSPYIPENLLRKAGITSSDSFDHVKAKLGAAFDAAAEEVIARDPAGKWDFLRHSSWTEQQVYFLEVEPEGVDPFTAEGSDFTVSVKWTEWSAYSPNSDLQNHDPSYTQYKSTAPQSARKMYMMLKENPAALKGISWGKFPEWLKANKINYGTHFSQWH